MKNEELQQTKRKSSKERYSRRVGRRDYWLKGLIPFYCGIWLILLIYSDAIPDILILAGAAGGGWVLYLGIGRCHDLNISGWWMLLTLLPLFGFLFTLYIGICVSANPDDLSDETPPALETQRGETSDSG